MAIENTTTVKAVTSGTQLTSVGTVKTVVGLVKAVDANGAERVLQVGDKVYASETIVTSADGGVIIEFPNGSFLDLPRSAHIMLDPEIYSATASKSIEQEAADEADRIARAIAEGRDPNAVADPAAAGGETGDEGTTTPLVVDFDNTQGNVTSGFPTGTFALAFPPPQEELPPLIEETPVAAIPPIVSVNVEVKVDTETETPDPREVIATSPGVVVDGISVVEGTEDVARTVNFVISLNQIYTQDVTVTYVINSGTASAGTDFSGLLTGAVTIVAGQTSFVVPVEIIQDSDLEQNENFSIQLTGATNATINPANSSAIVTIIDDDVHADNDTGAVTESQLESNTNVGVFASGNVLTNDDLTNAFAADGVTPVFGPLVVTTLASQPVFVGLDEVGTITFTSNGGYTLVLNEEGQAMVSALPKDQSISVSADYSITNTVNSTDTATLTITITGTNDGAQVTDDARFVTEDQDLNPVDGAADTVLSVDGEVTVTDVDQGEQEFNTSSLAFIGRTNSDVVDTDTAELGGLSINADGTYTFSVNNSAVQYLGAGDTVVQTYTVDSADGTGTSNIEITIYGTNDVPTLTGDATESVYESGLTDGSGTPPTIKTVTGALVFADIDTNDTLKLIVDGVDIGALAPDATNASTTVLGTTAGDYGTITFYLDGSWSYTLDSNVDNDTDLTPEEDFVVKINDGTVDSSTVTLHIDIHDDASVAADNTRTMVESTSVDNPIISDFSDSSQFLHAGKFFSAGSGNVAVAINGDGDIGFLRTGADSDSTATVLSFINANTVGTAPNLTEADFLSVANATGPHGPNGPNALTTFVQGSAFFVKDPNNLASSYTFTLDAGAIVSGGGTATMSFDFNFLTNEGDWNGTSWTSGEGNNKWAADDTLFMVLVKYDANGNYVSQTLTEITSVYAANDAYEYSLLGNNSYDFQTGTNTYKMNFNVADAGSYQLYFVVLDASTANPADSTALAIDNLRIDGGLENVTTIREVSGNVITNADIVTGATDVAGADGIAMISQIQVGGDIFTFDGTNNWTLSTNDGGTNASIVSYDDTTKLLTLETDIGGTLKITVDGTSIGNYTYTAPINSGATSDAIYYTLMDNDGSTSTATLAINILSNTTYDSVVEGTSLNDILNGTTGDDYMIGGAGADTFVWNSGDTGADTVTDFSVDQGDVLNVADLLSGGLIMTAVNSDGHLQLQISDGGSVVQTIDLTNVPVSSTLDAMAQMDSLLLSGIINDGI